MLWRKWLTHLTQSFALMASKEIIRQTLLNYNNVNTKSDYCNTVSVCNCKIVFSIVMVSVFMIQ